MRPLREEYNFKTTQENAVKLCLDALVSGEYQQARHVLCKVSENPGSPDKYCCLGVFTEVFRKYEPDYPITERVEYVQVAGEDEDDSEDRDVAARYYTYEGDHGGREVWSSLLPVIINWLGFYGSWGANRTIAGLSLANLNDKNKSFKEIHDILKAELAAYSVKDDGSPLLV